MGDTIKPEGTGKSLQSFIKYLPDYLQTIASNVPGFQQAMMQGEQVIKPQELALEQSLLGGFGPGYAEQSLNLAKMVDPEYYGLRTGVANKTADLINGLNPNELTGSEMAQIERGVNRTNQAIGTANIPSMSNAIANALTFGDRLMLRKKDTAGLIASTTPTLGAVKSGMDVFQQVTGRPGFSSQYGAVPTALAQNLYGEIGQNVRQNIDLTAKKRDWLDRVNETGSTIGSIAGGAAGFI